MQGFPEEVNELPTELHYYNFKEIIIFKDDEIVVPKSLIPKMVRNIHPGHFGIQNCLRRVR